MVYQKQVTTYYDIIDGNARVAGYHSYMRM